MKFKKYRIIKISLLTLLGIILILFSFGYWFISLLPPVEKNLESSVVLDLPYLSENVVDSKGKILAVVTSVDVMGDSGKSTGYELTELSRAYYVFKANGFEVDVASPLGGKPTVVIDDEDMGVFDYAFLNDEEAQHKVSNTIAMKNVIKEDYDAVYFVGGKGAMYDFPNNKHIQDLVRNYYETDKVIGAVCHGPAALVNITLANKRPLIENKRISCFTNKEELLLISEARSIFPFLLEDKITEQGAKFEEGEMYLEKICHDKNIITGQNPWSTWALAETMIKQLGHTPKHRVITGEENAVKVLSVYRSEGEDKAKELIKSMINNDKPLKRQLIASHSIVSVMKGEMGGFIDMIELTSYAKSCEEEREKI
ncbi:type 1 glutamine amidotransferase domain-containing protein [Pontimicrobium sp. IMCC45349]|uniref:type 1 glutamine amidotransferase domain-containing protein n=1 Tax=Pontimicrobium sp. IMCC45349 TaxID=3391574 RepID=UPI0039A06278